MLTTNLIFFVDCSAVDFYSDSSLSVSLLALSLLLTLYYRVGVEKKERKAKQ
jgi:hypothetical protein